MGGEQGPQMTAAAAIEERVESTIPTPSGHFEKLFREHHARVFQAAYRVSGNLADAEDALQTVFLRLLHRPEAVEAVDRLDIYLHRAAVNAALDVVRSKHVGRSLPLDDVPQRSLEDSGPAPDRRYQAGEIRDCLRRAMARMAPRAAEVFALRYLEDYSNTEIAAMLGISRAAVAVTLLRTRRQLQKQLRSFVGGAP